VDYINWVQLMNSDRRRSRDTVSRTRESRKVRRHVEIHSKRHPDLNPIDPPSTSRALLCTTKTIPTLEQSAWEPNQGYDTCSKIHVLGNTVPRTAKEKQPAVSYRLSTPRGCLALGGPVKTPCFSAFLTRFTGASNICSQRG
jgi:hypothetical protein